MIIVLDPADDADVVLQWEDIGAATITSATYGAISGVTITPVSVSGNTTTCRVRGLQHGRSYQLQAELLLSTGETINRNVALLGFNG